MTSITEATRVLFKQLQEMHPQADTALLNALLTLTDSERELLLSHSDVDVHFALAQDDMDLAIQLAEYNQQHPDWRNEMMLTLLLTT